MNKNYGDIKTGHVGKKCDVINEKKLGNMS